MTQRNDWDSLVNIYQSHKRNSMLRKQNELQKKQNRELEKQRVLREREYQANERHRKNLENIENKKLELLNQQFEHEKNIQVQRKKIFALSKKIKNAKETITVEEKYKLYSSIEKDYILINADIVPDLDYQQMYDDIKTYRCELQKDIRKILGKEVSDAAFSLQKDIEILQKYKDSQKITSFDNYEYLLCSLHNINLVCGAMPSIQDSETELLIAEINVFLNDFQVKTGNLCCLNKWLDSLNICKNIKNGFSSLLCCKLNVSSEFFAQSIKMKEVELTADQWNYIASFLKPYFFNLALPIDKYQEIQRIYDSLVALADIESENIVEYYRLKKEIQINKIKEICTKYTLKLLIICDTDQNNDLIAYSADKSFFIFSDKIEIIKKEKTQTISLHELCHLKDSVFLPPKYIDLLIDIIGEFNPEKAAELFQKSRNINLFCIGCGFYISFAILLWICNLPWWMLILCLFIAMLMPRLLESPNAKKRMQYLKTKQGVDYISYDKGWLDFENGMVRIGKSIKNAK